MALQTRALSQRRTLHTDSTALTAPDTTDLHMTLLGLAQERWEWVYAQMHPDDGNEPEASQVGNRPRVLSFLAANNTGMLPPTHSFEPSRELLKTIAVGLNFAKFGHVCTDKMCTYISITIRGQADWEDADMQ